MSSRDARDNALRSVLARLAAHPQDLTEILDEQAEPFIAFSPNRVVLAANAAGEAFFGYGRRQLAGQPVDVIVPERFRQPDAPAQVPLEDLTTVEIPGLRRDGTEIPTAWTYGHAPGPGGPVFVMVVCDSAEQARRAGEVEARFRAVYENALDGIALIDDQLRFVDVNPAGCKLLGRSRGELVGAPSSSVTPSGSWPSRERLSEFHSAGALAGEEAILHPDGSIHRAEFGAVANVSPGLHLSIFRDIEERKRREEAKQLLDDASVVLASSLDPDEILASVAGLCVPRAADWVAVDVLEDTGGLRRIAIAHADPAKVELVTDLRRRLGPAVHARTPTAHVVSTGKAQLFEVISDEVLAAAVGNAADLLEPLRSLGLLSGMVVPLAARGKVIGAITFVCAESRRSYRSGDLAFAEELARRAGHAIENALYVRDLQVAHQTKDLFLRRAGHLQATATRLVRAASVAAVARAFELDEPASAADAYGWSLLVRTGDGLALIAATSGARDSSVGWPAVALDADHPLAEAIRSRTPIWLGTTAELLARYPTLPRQAMSTAVVSRAAIPLVIDEVALGAMGVTFAAPHGFDADERAYLTAVADLWAQALHRVRLMEAEQEAIRRALAAETLATRKRDEFLAMLGHELRNPLAPIVTATAILRLRGRVTDREIDILDRQARHMVRLVDDLLDISRIASGKLTLRRATVSVADVIGQAIESTAPVFSERRVRLLSAPAPASATVDGDRERLVQVVVNVLVNAAKFTPAGKAVHVASDSEDGQIVITVRDEGRGIEPELLPEVFELFAQGRQTSDRPSGGLGLGLAIARSIVTAHQGTIAVTSAGLGRGSTVTIRLPATVAPRIRVPRPPERTEPTPGAGPGKRRVLIVDDNEDSASLLADLLGDVGYECYVAFDAKGALSIIGDVLPDAAILDIGLPDVDGHELARQIRTTLAEKAPKLIALTGYARETDRARAIQAGFLEHLAKPVELSELTAKLSGLLGAGSA